jgi:hypothetical protein
MLQLNISGFTGCIVGFADLFGDVVDEFFEFDG